MSGFVLGILIGSLAGAALAGIGCAVGLYRFALAWSRSQETFW